MTALQLIDARERDLGGGFVVRRVLPHDGRQMVGPFIFFDHMGPTQFEAGHGVDVRPHPHIALATVTYLFAGSLEHRDSLGTVREIRPGDVNWMTAGRGIAHSERTPKVARMRGEMIHGIQSWVALPDGFEEVEPGFAHYPASSLPRRVGDGIDLSVIAGHAFGLRSPVATLWPTLYVHARFAPGASLMVPPEHPERAVYVVEGELAVGEIKVSAGKLAVLEPGTEIALRAAADRAGETLAMLLGGDRFATPRYIWWNFVASSRERIELAKQAWVNRQFAPVPGETEFIPLPSA
ncbi:MAG TPA: pirin family protein [Steroidobacteraceae bacterium]|jgi:redox-sensitive bicupin YhaK (pirin superfamily)|nr:pirin family protein [Steroidobacteraceae bacterium]